MYHSRLQDHRRLLKRLRYEVLIKLLLTPSFLTFAAILQRSSDQNAEHLLENHYSFEAADRTGRLEAERPELRGDVQRRLRGDRLAAEEGSRGRHRLRDRRASSYFKNAEIYFLLHTDFCIPSFFPERKTSGTSKRLTQSTSLSTSVAESLG